MLKAEWLRRQSTADLRALREEVRMETLEELQPFERDLLEQELQQIDDLIRVRDVMEQLDNTPGPVFPNTPLARIGCLIILLAFLLVGGIAWWIL